MCRLDNNKKFNSLDDRINQQLEDIAQALNISPSMFTPSKEFNNSDNILIFELSELLKIYTKITPDERRTLLAYARELNIDPA